MSIMSRSTMLLRHRLQPVSSWCGAMSASDSPAMRRWMSDKKVEHEGEDMPNFDVRPEAGNVGESTTEQYTKSAKEAANFVTRGVGYLANAAKQAVVGDGLARENHNPAGEVTATRRTGDQRSTPAPIHRMREYISGKEGDDTRSVSDRYPAMKEAAGRQSDHLQGTSGGDDKAYSQLAPESGPHQDKNTRSPPGPHDVSG